MVLTPLIENGGLGIGTTEINKKARQLEILNNIALGMKIRLFLTGSPKKECFPFRKLSNNRKSTTPHTL